jgi:hypothetical protein
MCGGKRDAHEVRRIGANIAKLPALLAIQRSRDFWCQAVWA